jgi:hypothetical protein
MKHTIECLCGYIATFENQWNWICPDCGREWQFDNKGRQSQCGLPTNKKDIVPGFDSKSRQLGMNPNRVPAF